MKRRKIADKTIYPDQASTKRSSIQVVPEVNIKEDMPSVVIALRRIKAAIDRNLVQGTPAIKIIHGYGSSGVGGDIKIAVHARLRKMANEKKIIDFIPGEQFDRTRVVLQYLEDFSHLEWDPDFGRNNRGISIVLIQHT